MPPPTGQRWQLSVFVYNTFKFNFQEPAQLPLNDTNGFFVETRVFGDEGGGGVATSQNHGGETHLKRSQQAQYQFSIQLVDPLLFLNSRKEV